ncbi:MAG TPA: PAS domain-containing protein, partial [Chitinophagaceae bacterium]|nr:PAS domain-containing protein [Chitinophagaceae bacterium]
MQFCIDEAPCIFFAAKDDGTLVAANTSLCILLGFEQSSLIGEKVDRILTIPSRIFQQTHFFPLLKMKGHAEEIYITLRGSDGYELPVLINAERKMVDGQAVSFYIGIVVHNRKKFEDELVAARKAAETALRENSELLRIKTELNEHAETLDRQMGQLKRQNVELLQFNRVVTHDLQEPLRKLFIFTNLMLEGKEEIGSTRTVEKIRTVSEQMRSIVSGLQQYIWLTDAAENRRTVDLNQVMTSIIKTITDSSSDVEINFEGDHLPLIVGDEEQLHFLFQELVANAIQNRKPNQGLHIRIVATGL